MKKFFTLVLFTAMLLKIFAQECPPNDPTFGTNGKAISNAWADYSRTIVQPDGKIIQVANIVSGQYDGFFLHRLNVNGSTDMSFGTSGKITILSSDRNNYYHISDIVLQPDGKIVIAGNKLNYNTDFFNIVLYRFNNNGSADPNFGNNGEKLIEMDSGWAQVKAITLQAGGKIIISGTSYRQVNLCQIPTWSYPGVFIARLNLDGSTDNSFGVNGKLVLNALNYLDENLDVKVQSNGKILLASSQGYDCSCQPGYYGGLEWICNKKLLLLRRLNADGTSDPSFGINGQITDSTMVASTARIIIMPDDKIIIATANYSADFLVNRYTSDGALDIGFGRGGKSVSSVVNGSNRFPEFYDATIQPDGKILLLGNTYDNSNGVKSVLVRYKSNGDLDSSFYLNGASFFTIDIGKPSEFASSVAMQGNMIIIGGNRSDNNSRNLIAIRFLEKSQSFEPNVIADGPLTFCSGDSVKLSTSLTGNYQWYLSSNTIPGGTNAIFKATAGGTYRLMVNNSTGCGISSAVHLVEKPRPLIFNLNWNGTRLSADSIYTKYQWYLNGAAISGANSNGYAPGTNLGTYKVQVTNAENCSNFSNDFSYVITGIADLVLGDTKMRYYPNPAQTRLNIDIAKLSGKKISGDLFDMSGKLMVSQSFRQGHNEIILSGIPSGVYSLVIRSGNETAVRKLMIVK